MLAAAGKSRLKDAAPRIQCVLGLTSLVLGAWMLCEIPVADAFFSAPAAGVYVVQPCLGMSKKPMRASLRIGSPLDSPMACRQVARGAISMMQEVLCDVAIVGGGPAGCTCALYSARSGLKTILVDKNPATGALAITSTIANYPGVDTSTSGRSLLDKMRQQAIDFGTDYRREQVYSVECDGEYKIVLTPNSIIKARALVLATGAMGRPASFKGEDTFLGRGVSYCATCDAAFCRDREVAVVGYSQEAKDELQVLTGFASTVHWIVPGVPHADEEAAQDILALPNVKQWSNTRLLSIEGDDSGVTGIVLKKTGMAESSKDEDDFPANGNEVFLQAEMVFIYVAGLKPVTDFLSDQQIAIKDDGGVKVNEDMETSASGTYAIGDIRNTPFKQVVVAAAEGCMAAMAIHKKLTGRKKVKVDWKHDTPEALLLPKE